MDSNFINYTEDHFMDNDQEPLLENVTVVLTILTIILSLCVIVVDILLIYVIITKFKMHQSTANSYIILYAIFNMLYCVGNAVRNLVFMITTSSITEKQICLLISIPDSFLLINFLFAFALGFDWLIMTFKREFGQKIKKYYKYFTILIYFLGCVDFQTHLTLCITKDGLENSNLINNIVSTVYIIILLFILVLDYFNLRYKSSIRPTHIVYSLIMANTIVLCWSPGFICNILLQVLAEYFAYTSINFEIFAYVNYILQWIGISASIVVLIALIKINAYMW